MSGLPCPTFKCLPSSLPFRAGKQPELSCGETFYSLVTDPDNQQVGRASSDVTKALHIDTTWLCPKSHSTTPPLRWYFPFGSKDREDWAVSGDPGNCPFSNPGMNFKKGNFFSVCGCVEGV